jgi:hypothetical protein
MRLVARASFVALCAGAFGLCSADPAVSAKPSSEEEVKAAVVFNILQFVKWPENPAGAGQPLVLCAPDAEGVARHLPQYAGASLHDSTVAIRTLNRRLDGLAACQAVFVPAGSPYLVLQISAATQGKPVLVIAEGSGALQQGAGMAVSLAGGRVAIDVDLAAVNASGLNVSSKLLRLARTVIK